MARLTVKSTKPTIAAVIGVSQTDTARIVRYVNEAVQRILATRRRWVGTVQKYRICINTGCITWPRQIEAIEAFAVCDHPGTIQNQWYEFLDNGPGQLDEDNHPGTRLVPQGLTSTFAQPTNPNFVFVQSAVAEAAGARILIQGYDENAQWIRTQDAGEFVNGEFADIGTAGVNTTKKFSAVTGVIKPQTNDRVHLFEHDGVAIVKALAQYEYDEELPEYIHSLIPGLPNMAVCDNAAEGCQKKWVTVMARMAFVPVAKDNDFIITRNLPALKHMVQAILHSERQEEDRYAFHQREAFRLLDGELAAHQGSGAVVSPDFPPRDAWGGGIRNLIAGHHTHF